MNEFRLIGKRVKLASSLHRRCTTLVKFDLKGPFCRKDNWKRIPTSPVRCFIGLKSMERGPGEISLIRGITDLMRIFDSG